MKSEHQTSPERGRKTLRNPIEKRVMARIPIVLLALYALLAQPTAAAVREVVLCEADPMVASGFVASSDAQHLAWIETTEGRERVVLDGAPGPHYETVSNIVFSEDGSHIAYVVRTDRPAVPRVDHRCL
jgi:hypothetical protein